MAAGDTLLVFGARESEQPASNYAFLRLRNNQWVLVFDPSTDKSVYFSNLMPSNYSGGDIDLILIWVATSAVSGTCRWSGAFDRQADADTQTDDIDTDTFATAKTIGDSPPGTNAGRLQYTTLSFSSAEVDGIQAGERVRLQIARDADGTSGTDDMAGEAELLMVVLKEV